MKNLINFDDVNNKIITIRNENVILDSDVAALYNVETKEINQAVRNNPNKFPEGYIVRLTKDEWSNLKSKFSISNGEDSLRSKFLTLNDTDNLKSKISTSNTEDSLRSKFSTLDKQGRGQHKKYAPCVFTEKGLYMLATILKSPQATETTIAIVEAFAKLKQLSNNLAALHSMEPE
ncbi:MAG: ORF6N domain-containing protein, partial [Bacteroidales bacterium]|nr:ORF6N domain-containing protein [Bacteroidales bacterium]